MELSDAEMNSDIISVGMSRDNFDLCDWLSPYVVYNTSYICVLKRLKQK
jgi:hypothetical protein